MTTTHPSLKVLQYLYYFLILILLVISSWLLFEFNYSTIKENFTTLTPMVGLSIIVVFLFGTIFTLFVRPIQKVIQKLIGINVRLWLLITIILMISTYTIGFAFISDTLGKPNLSLVLRDTDKNGEVVGEIECNDDSGVFLANHYVSCTLKKPELHNFNASVSFTYTNDTAEIRHYNTNESITFISPYETKRVGFNINGFDGNNTFRRLEVSRDFTFFTKEENIQRNDKLLAYLLGLLAIVAFSIPSMMVSFKNLYERGI